MFSLQSKFDLRKFDLKEKETRKEFDLKMKKNYLNVHFDYRAIVTKVLLKYTLTTRL